MSIAASRPSATAVTVRSSPPAAQSPPAQTPGRPVRPGPVTAILPPSTTISPGRLAEPLADRGQHLVGGEGEGLGRRALGGVGELDLGRRAVAADPDRRRAADDAHPGRGGELLLVAAGAHPRPLAAVDDRHLLGAELLRLHAGVDRGHAAADDDDAPADRQRGEVRRLAQLGDEVDRGPHASLGRALGLERPHAAEADPEEHRVEVGAQRLERHLAPEPHAGPELDAADAEQPVELGLGEAVRRPCRRRCRTR